ncbi:MAG: hypothetical protein LUH02_01300 [Erysipelotrichaceae bacterium]|nr:hypothetical protein [Erysipelotrichaceae bacterium]
MSITVACYKDHHVYLACDGRDEDDLYFREFEDLSKLKKYGNSCIIGYSGCYFVFNKTFEQFEYLYGSKIIYDDFYFRFYFKRSLKNAYYEYKFCYETPKVTSFIIAFKTKMLTISTYDFEFHEQVFEDNQTYFAKAYYQLFLNQKFEIIKDEEISKDVSPRETLIQIINRVAEIDVTVNNNVFMEIL